MGGEKAPYTIPDWRIYKVEDCPELVELREKLAKKGLSNPWLRNEVWKFNRKNFPTARMTLFTMFTRGLKYAVPLMALTVLVKSFWGEDQHHHSAEHH